MHDRLGEHQSHSEECNNRSGEHIGATTAPTGAGSIRYIAGDRVGDCIPDLANHEYRTGKCCGELDNIGQVVEEIEPDGGEKQVPSQISNSKAPFNAFRYCGIDGVALPFLCK